MIDFDLWGELAIGLPDFAVAVPEQMELMAKAVGETVALDLFQRTAQRGEPSNAEILVAAEDVISVLDGWLKECPADLVDWNFLRETRSRAVDTFVEVFNLAVAVPEGEA